MDELFCAMADDDARAIILVDALNEGVLRSIQTSGVTLPTSSVEHCENLCSYPVQCEWTEFSSELCSAVVEDLRQYFPPLVGSEVGSNGRTLLYSACIGLLLSRSERRSNITRDKTPLDTFVSIVSFLLDELDVDPNQPTQTKGACLRPPLHVAARSCYPLAVHELLARGADPNLPDEEGWTALMACCLPDVLSREQGGPTDEERVDTLKALMTSKDNAGVADHANARNYCGYSALHYACEGLSHSLINCLLDDGGADATLRTVWGQSCIGIINTQKDINRVEAMKCKAIILSHLEKTGQKSIDTFLEEEEKAVELLSLVDNVLLPAARHAEPIIDLEYLSSQDERIVTALMKHLELDPTALFQNRITEDLAHEDGCNLYETIYCRVMGLIPAAYQKVYKSNPTDEEREIITCTNFSIRKTAEISVLGVRHVDASVVMGDSFRLHRERGHVARQMELLTDLIVGPLQRTLAFGIPSNSVVEKISAHSPLVEMGAGTGYWSHLLSRSGADIMAFDAHPPGESMSKDLEGKNGNEYFGAQSYFPVQKGVASSVFVESKPEMAERALLIVWPNNPDEEDNAHVAVKGSVLPQIWDLDCLQRYHKLGGSTVIYVGERETEIELMPGATAESGFCASRKFQVYLRDNYELEAVLTCPRWWMKEDDATIWKRK